MYLIGIIDQVLMTVEEEISDFLLEVGEVVGEVATGRIKNQMETGKVYTNTNRYSVTCVIGHTGGPDINVGLSRLSECSGFFCKDRHILAPEKCVG